MRNAIILLAACLAGLQARAEEITVAVASNFTATMHEIVAEFEAATGHEVTTVHGSSGSLYAQIVNGAPFQAFFSADQPRPRGLEQAGHAVTGSRFTYAIGRLALWSADEHFVDGMGDVLKQGDFSRLAIANPDLAPYGVAAVEVLENLNLAGPTRTKWVQGQNIAQTYQFVVTGNAQLGFVALPQLMNLGANLPGSVWIVPEGMYSPILQDAVLLQQSEGNPAVREFLEFVRGPRGRAIIESHGYGTP